MKNTFGFIGTGTMGSTLAEAAAKTLPLNNICLSNRTLIKAEALARRLGCRYATATDTAASCSFLLLGVKPQQMEMLLTDLSPVLAERKDEFVLVSMAADFIMVLVAGNLPGEIMLSWPVVIFPMVTMWYILTETGSIIENAVSMGAKVPQWLPRLLNATVEAIDHAVDTEQ